MDSAGIFSGNTVDIQSVRLEPYVLGSNFADRVLLVGEVRYLLDFCPHLSILLMKRFHRQILLLVWLGKFFVDFVWSTVEISLIVGFKKAIGSWAIVDALNLVRR
jgi:hypothetical protein